MVMTPRLRTVMTLLALLGCSGGAHGADCALNDNPACPGVNLGTISGDAASNGITRTGTGEAFFTVLVKETSSTHPRPLNARIELVVPPGMDYDLIVRCASCTGTAAQNAKKGIGIAETVNVTRADTFSDNSFTLVIEIRYFAGKGCAPWTLAINGNTAAAHGAMSCG